MKRKVTFTIITFLIGFMLAIQYKSTNQVNERDTRNLWNLRVDYLKAKEMETKLLQEIRDSEEKIRQYETGRVNSGEVALRDTVEELRNEAGLKEAVGPGIVLTFSKATEFIKPGHNEVYVSPVSLRKLLNELNMYGAKAISIADQRVITSTVIREIQGETKIDGYPIRRFPFDVKIITKDFETANKLFNRMQISTISDDFIIDNIRVSISQPKEQIVIPAYGNSLRVEVMEPVNDEGGI